MIRHVMLALMLAGSSVALPQLAAAQQTKQNASAEDPNDKAAKDRSFEETRKHMQLHSEWSKKSGKMSDN